MGDAMGLTWQKVDLTRRTITIDRTKNGDPITVPMHDDVFFELANLPHRKGLVFGFGNRRQFLDDWHKACDSLGIERRRSEGGLTPHGMRHSFATWLRQQGKGLREIMQAGGWQNEKAAMRYLHIDAQETVEAVTNLPSLRAKSVHSDAKEG
jgi:integrase